MRIGAKYSHLNGEEYLQVRRPTLWREVQEVIANVDVETCKAKKSRKQTMQGQFLYSHPDINQSFKSGFERSGWDECSNTIQVTDDEQLSRRIHGLSPENQKAAIEAVGHDPIMSCSRAGFVKERVAVDIQFGKNAFIGHDLFVKNLSFYASDIIDVGIEILPMKELEKNISSNLSYYEHNLLIALRQGRTARSAPLVLIGVLP